MGTLQPTGKLLGRPVLLQLACDDLSKSEHPARASSRRRPDATVRPQMGEDRRRVLAEHTPNQLEPLAALPAIPDLRTLRCGKASLLSHRPPHPLQGKVSVDPLNLRSNADIDRKSTRLNSSH